MTLPPNNMSSLLQQTKNLKTDSSKPQKKQSSNWFQSRVFTCVGEKYKQAYNVSVSPTNVFPSLNIKNKNNQKIGYRMEDHFLVGETFAHSSLIRIFLMSDGHGASRMHELYYFGGYECAKFINQNILDKLSNIHKTKNLNCYFETVSACNNRSNNQYKKIAPLILDLFKTAQNDFLMEMNRGALREDNSGDTNRIRELCQNKIDGPYFSKIYKLGDHWEGNTLTTDQCIEHFVRNLNGQDCEAIVVDKKLIDYQGSLVPCYINRNGSIVNYPDFGTTTTLVLVIDDFVLTANVGDSEVKLFYQSKNSIQTNLPSTGVCTSPTGVCAAGVKEMCLTENHTTSNSVEVERMKLYETCVEKNYFMANINGKYKMIMPSRSMGHIYFSHHGISFKPTLFSLVANCGDIIIIGTDGLWNHCSPTKIRKIVASALAKKTNNVVAGVNTNKIGESVTTESIANKIGERIYKSIHKKYAHKHDNITFIVLHCQIVDGQ